MLSTMGPSSVIKIIYLESHRFLVFETMVLSRVVRIKLYLLRKEKKFIHFRTLTRVKIEYEQMPSNFNNFHF